MTPADSLLEKLSSWQPAPAGPHSLTARLPADGVEVTVTADRVDPTGAVVRDIRVSRTAPRAEAESLPDRASRVASTARGLSENLRVLEVDAGRDEAVLRSDAPAETGGGKHYYEVVLGGSDRASVNRYHAPAGGGKRAAEPFPLTHEAIAKLGEVLG